MGTGYALQYHPEVNTRHDESLAVTVHIAWNCPGAKQRHEHNCRSCVHVMPLGNWLATFIDHWMGLGSGNRIGRKSRSDRKFFWTVFERSFDKSVFALIVRGVRAKRPRERADGGFGTTPVTERPEPIGLSPCCACPTALSIFCHRDVYSANRMALSFNTIVTPVAVWGRSPQPGQNQRRINQGSFLC
jgi:hypothetical protein